MLGLKEKLGGIAEKFPTTGKKAQTEGGGHLPRTGEEQETGLK